MRWRDGRHGLASGSVLIAIIGQPAVISVVLVDDHRTVLRGLELALGGPGTPVRVVGTATNAQQALHLAATCLPDVLVLDLDLSGSDGAELIPKIVANQRTVVLVLTGVTDVERHRGAVMLGARGVVHKEVPPEQILKAIEKVHAGELWLDRVTTAEVVDILARRAADAGELADPRIGALTQRERQIIVAMCDDAGAPAKRIASRLDISEHTLRNHLTSIYEKLGVGSRLELFDFAQRHGLAGASNGTGQRPDR